MLETSNFVHGTAMWSLSLVMSKCSLCGRGQVHVSNFYIVECRLRKFRHSKSSVYRWYPQLVRGRFVYDIYRTMDATRSRNVWVHMFITYCPTVTLQIHNFDLFRTCRTSSFCTVAWQLADFNWHDASRGPSAIAELLVTSTVRVLVWSVCCQPAR